MSFGNLSLTLHHQKPKENYMELTTRIKNAVSYGRDLMSKADENPTQNNLFNNLKNKSLEAVTAVVNSTSTYFSNLNQEVKASMADHSRHYDVIKADEPIDATDEGLVAAKNPALHDIKKTVSSVKSSVVKLSKRQLNIIRLILRQEDKFTVRNNGEYSIANLHNEMFITADTLSKKYKVHARTIQRDLSLLQHIGLIEHVGSDKGGYWRAIRTNI